MDADKGLLATLFDFSFDSFITTKVIKLLFVVGILCSVVGTLFFIGDSFNRGWGLGFLGLLVSPLFFLVLVLLIRVGLELLMVLFRIAEDVHHKSPNEPTAEVISGASTDGVQEAEILDPPDTN